MGDFTKTVLAVELQSFSGKTLSMREKITLIQSEIFYRINVIFLCIITTKGLWACAGSDEGSLDRSQPHLFSSF